MSFQLLLAGLGLWLLIEGAIYAVAPDFMRRMAALLAAMSSKDIAVAGLGSAGLGAICMVIAVRYL